MNCRINHRVQMQISTESFLYDVDWCGVRVFRAFVSDRPVYNNYSDIIIYIPVIYIIILCVIVVKIKPKYYYIRRPASPENVNTIFHIRTANERTGYWKQHWRWTMVLLILSEKWIVRMHTGRSLGKIDRWTRRSRWCGKAWFYIKSLLLEYVHWKPEYSEITMTRTPRGLKEEYILRARFLSSFFDFRLIRSQNILYIIKKNSIFCMLSRSHGVVNACVCVCIQYWHFKHLPVGYFW